MENDKPIPGGAMHANRENEKRSIPSRMGAGKVAGRKKKEITQAVLDANRANAKKSSGPRTAAGKLNAKFGALTHGFFARELVLNDEEKRHFETIRRTLCPQLAPETILQGFKFAEIMACIGRCKLALRLEMRRIRRVLGQDSAEQAQSDQIEGQGARADWYLSGKQGLREGIRLLEAVKQDFLRLGRIDEKWHALLDKAFGSQLRQLLMQWAPSNQSAVLLAQQITDHAETYNLPLPPSLEQALCPDADGETKPKVILDPQQNEQMTTKLFELEGSMLSDLWRSAEQRASASAQNDTVDYAPKYFSTACRDLDRAIDRFMYLKKNNL